MLVGVTSKFNIVSESCDSLFNWVLVLLMVICRLKKFPKKPGLQLSVISVPAESPCHFVSIPVAKVCRDSRDGCQTVPVSKSFCPGR